MKKALYFTIDKNVSGDGETLDGTKTINVYEIIDNKPKVFTTIEADLSDNSKKLIQEYLDDNGHGDEEFDLIIL